MVKLSDVSSPLISDGSNLMNTSLGYLKRHLMDLDTDYGLELKPDFQRGHVWTEDQQIKFMEYILNGGNCGIIHLNYPHWNTAKSDPNSKIVCVDGLQRMTTYLRFVCNKLPVFGGHKANDFEDRDKIFRRILLTFNINTLQTRSEVIKWYLQLNYGGTPHTSSELKRVTALMEDELIKERDK